MRNIFIRIARFPFYRYPFTRWIFKKFFFIVAKHTGRDLAAYPVLSSPLEAEIFQQLREKGLFLAKPENFSSKFYEKQSKAMDAAMCLINEGLPKLKGTKEYILNLDLSKAPMSAIQSMYEFFSCPELEALASLYLGDKALMVELKILVSPAMEVPDIEGSQLWHSDFDDESNLKLFVFLDEVTEDSGPLQVVAKPLSCLLMDRWRYRWGKQGISHNDDIVPHEYSSEIVSLVGAAGSIVFFDSVKCLHRGSRNPKRSRKILYASFTTRSSFRFPPFHWVLGTRFAGSRLRTSPLLKLDPEETFLTDLAINK